MTLDAEPVRTYMERLLLPRDVLLRRLEREAEEEGWPIVGPHVGSLLHILTAAVGARRALELGTAIGYSATWIARGLPAGGRMVTVEVSEETAQRARRNLQEAGLGEVVEVRVGEAVELLPELGTGYDIIFNDIDKEGYPASLPLCKEALRPGGLLVTDNVLWSGRVADPEDRSPATEAIRAYNRRLAEDPEMATVILPLRDGVSISVKRA